MMVLSVAVQSGSRGPLTFLENKVRTISESSIYNGSLLHGK